MARSNLKVVHGDGFADWIESATAQLQAQRTSVSGVTSRAVPGQRSLPELNFALEVVTAAVFQAKSQESAIQSLTEELGAAERKQAAAEESEKRLVALLEKAMATLMDAKQQLAKANARADQADHDLAELRRILGVVPPKKADS